MGRWRDMVGAWAAAGRPRGRGGLVSAVPGWLWPYWLERQLDPESPAFLPPAHFPFPPNVTHRNWTLVANLASPGAATVDQRGLVTPRAGGWSLDWWIGAEDRWHLPSREPAVRQSLAGSAPVVETAMRIPGGDARQRVYAVAAAHPGDLAVVEVENGSAVPVAVAFTVRPCNAEGLAPVERIALDATTVLVDGRPAVLLPRPPAGVAASTRRQGDSLHAVTAGRAVPNGVDVHDPEGLAQAAFVYPLPPRGALRVAMPLAAERPRRPGGASWPHRRRETAPPVDVAALPGPADVARGWQAHLRRGLRADLPDPRLLSAVDANRAYLLLFHTGSGVRATGRSGGAGSFLEAASVLVALDRFGFHAEAGEALRSRPWTSMGTGAEAHAGAVWAIAEHHRLTGDAALLGELIPAVREAARVLAGTQDGPALPHEIGFWSVRALVDAAWLLRLAGDGAAAAAAEAAAAGRRKIITASLDEAAARLGRLAMPAGPGRGFDAAMISALVACAPLGLLPPDDPWVLGTLEVIRERFCLGDAFHDGAGHTGLAPSLTLRIGRCELEAGDPRAWRRLRWMLDAATTTFTWPEALHPRLGGGCVGDGHHGGAAAAFLGFLRQVLVREVPSGGLALATILPPEWAGQPLEVHDAPTHHGRISYALRWHGERPALLWRCERPGVPLTVPGLDPSFSTVEQEGEALLAPYRVRIPIPVEEADRP